MFTFQHPDFQRNSEFQTIDDETGNITRHVYHRHDIALLELEESLTFSHSIQHACLPNTHGNQVMADDYVSLTEIEQNGDCWTTGWGETNGKNQVSI